MACLNYDSESESDYDFDQYDAIPTAGSETKAEESSEREEMPIGISSDPILIDKDRHQLFYCIQETWHIYGNRDGMVLRNIHDLLNRSGDPYLSATYVMRNTFDFDKSKPNSLSLYVIEQFESWLEEFKRLNGTYPSLSKQTILEAINAVADQKNIKLITKVVNIYRGIESKEILICIVKNHYLKSSFATACRLAIALQLFRHFEIQDFILPLIVQDKLPLAEEYLSYNVDMQKATISLLDKHLEHPHDVLPLISKTRIPEVSYHRLVTKNMGNYITRLIKRFELNKECCPRTTFRQQAAGLRYLVHKKYSDKSIEHENWEELVHVAVADSLHLQMELINILCRQYSDDQAAVSWAMRYSMPHDSLPHYLPPLMIESEIRNKNRTHQQPPVDISPAKTKSVSDREYYSLKLSFSKIRWISSWIELQECANNISKSNVIGFDVEWQPTFGAQIARAAVLQIATGDEAYLIDILSLRENEKLETHQGETFVQQVFANPNVLKLGFSMKEDLNVLSRSLSGFENITKSMRKWIDLHSLWGNIQRCYPVLLPKQEPKNEGAKGLSGLAKLTLGLPLDKKEQFSDWERRPLRPSQLTYAALDAHCLVEIYNVLQRRSEKIGVDWWQLLEKSTPNLNSKPSRGRGRGRFPIAPPQSQVGAIRKNSHTD